MRNYRKKPLLATNSVLCVSEASFLLVNVNGILHGKLHKYDYLGKKLLKIDRKQGAFEARSEAEGLNVWVSMMKPSGAVRQKRTKMLR